MFDALYRRRLEGDLEEWVAREWITPAAAGKIIADLSRQARQNSRLPAILATIGVVCLALAVAAFVAANWDAIARPVKLAGILLAIPAANALAAYAASRGRPFIADLATFFAALVFIAGLALVAQIYHLPQDWPAGAVLATLGSLAAAWIAGSRLTLLVAAGAAIAWVFARADPVAIDIPAAVYSIVIVSAIGLHAVVYPSRLSRYATILLIFVVYIRLVAEAGFGGWIFEHGLLIAIAALAAGLIGAGLALDRFGQNGGPSWLRQDGVLLFAGSCLDTGATALVGVVVVNLISTMIDPPSGGGLFHILTTWPILVMIAVAVAMIALAAANAGRRNAVLAVAVTVVLGFAAPVVAIALPDAVVLHAALALIAVVAVSGCGAIAALPYWTAVGHLGTAIVALWLLNETVGSLIGQSVFFLIAGVALIGVAGLVARRYHRRAGAKGEGA